MITLGIETSCDETSLAVLRDDRELLANVIASSAKLHEKFGGVVPEIASRHSLEYIYPTYLEAIEKAKIDPQDIDIIGVTKGPGLIGSLLVGLEFAKGLSYSLSKPLIGIHHLEGHLFVNFIDREKIPERFIGLIVSGGHTCLVLVEGDKIQLIGETRDDALGEAFDKVAKILDLGFPGGPRIEKTALNGDESKIAFNAGNLPGSFDFSFSGIKTAVLYYAKKQKDLAREIPHICASFQKSVFDVVTKKTLQAVSEHRVDHLVVGGGVSANQYFKKKIEQAAPSGLDVLFPPIQFAVDNAAMIAKRAYEVYQMEGFKEMPIGAEVNLNFAVRE